MVDSRSPIPLYYQIEEELRRNIEAGKWPPETQIPSERELCETYGVSRGPVRQALQNLETAGLIRAVQGKGVIVNEQRFEADILVSASFFKEIERLGMKPSSEILWKELAVPSPTVARMLGLEVGAEIVVIQRLIKGDELPLALAVTHLPAAFFPGLLELDLTEVALYDLIVNQYKIPIRSVRESFEPVLPTPDEAHYLELTEQQPSLRVHRVILSRSGPVDYTTLLVRSDRCRYTLEIPVS